MSHSPSWSIADILDFEYLLSAESGADHELTAGRDARLFREKIAPKLGSTRLGERRAVFREWLEARREEEREALPGAQFTAGWRLLIALGILVGLFLGAGATGALLRYEKLEPINVATFLGWTLGVQWLVLLLAAVFWALRRSLPELRDLYPLQALLWMFDAALRRLPGEQREKLRAGLSVLAHKRRIYGSLTVWPLVIVTQLFAVAFNVAVLGTLLAHVSVVDTRFGWQTTFGGAAGPAEGLVPEQVDRIVRAMAVPWAWTTPHAQPTLELIVASRYVHGQDFETLPAAATRAWWPFLFLTIACYGLAVRAALLAVAASRLRRSLGGAAFDHAECNALFRRLTGPLVQPGPECGGPFIPETEPAAPHAAAGAPCFGLIAEDMELSEEQLTEHLHQRYGWKLIQCSRAQIDHPTGNAPALAALAGAGPGLDSVVVAAPSRRAPIKAIALFIEKVKAAAGGKPELLVLLVGRKSDGSYAPVTDEELRHWRNFSAINRLHVGIEKWSAS